MSDFQHVDVLSRAGLLHDTARWEALPGGRTNRVWKVQDNDRVVVVKLYLTGHENPLFPNIPEAEIQVLKSPLLQGVAPAFLGEVRGAIGTYLVYEYWPGHSWKKHPKIAANLLAKLHKCAPVLNLRDVPNGSQRIRDQTAAILASLPEAMTTDLNALRPRSTIAPTDQICILHGDAVPGNILVNHDQGILIDWQCPGIGDPCEDLSSFLSPAMQLLYRGAPLTGQERQSFLDAYSNPEISTRMWQLAPWYHWRMAAYCLWKCAQGDHAYHAGYLLECAELESYLS